MMHEISRNIMKYARWNMIMLRDGHDKTYIITKHMNNSIHAQTPWHLLQCRCDPLPLWDTSANLRAMSHYKPEKVGLKLEELENYNFGEKTKKLPQITKSDLESQPVMESLRVARSSLFHSEDLQAL